MSIEGSNFARKPKERMEMKVEVAPELPAKITPELLTEQQRILRGRLAALGIIDLIQEATGAKVPDLLTIGDRSSDPALVDTDYIKPAKFHPESLFRNPNDQRAWEITIPGVHRAVKTNTWEVDEQFLPRSVEGAPTVLRMDMMLDAANAGTPMGHSLAHVIFDGSGIAIVGESYEFFGKIPQDIDDRKTSVSSALGKALTHPRFIQNPRYSR